MNPLELMRITKLMLKGERLPITRTPADKWIALLTPPGEIAAVAFRNAHPTWIAESFSRVLGLGELDAALATAVLGGASEGKVAPG